MTETVPKGSGQLDPETAARINLLIDQGQCAQQWGKRQSGDRQKDYALDEIERVLGLLREVICDV